MTTTEELVGLSLAVIAPLLDPLHRIFVPFLVGSLLLAVVVGLSTGHRFRTLPAYLFPRKLWFHRSAVVDYQLFLCKVIVRWAGVLPWGVASWGLAVALVGGLDGQLGIPAAPDLSAPVVTALYSTVLFLSWDGSRYVLHRMLHQVPLLWRFHQVHHSAEVLTPLTFYRSHPVESFLYWLRGVLVTGLVAGGFFWVFRGQADVWQIASVHGLGFLFNLAGGNLRHSHVWLSWGRTLEHVVISPAQHQLHHRREAASFDRNFGAWLAVWDWVGGTLELAGRRRVLRFGLPQTQRNHAPRSLVSILVDPVADALRPLRPARWGLLLVLSAGWLVVLGTASADEGEGPPEDGGEGSDSEDDGENEDGEGDEEAADQDAPRVREVFSVIGRREGPARVAGSAHRVTQEQLERAEQDDIHELVKDIPGVYVRGEDGAGLRPNIGLRGAAADRSAKVTLMEDGVLLAPAPYSAPAAYYFPMTTRMVGIEVFKGAAATRHGPNTVGGAINLLTRTVPEVRDLQLDVAVGMHESWKAHAWGGARASWGGVVFDAVHGASGGFKELGDDMNTGFGKTEVMVKARLNTPLSAPVVSAWELKGGFAHEDSRETYLGLSDGDFEEDPYQRYIASSLGHMRWQRSQAELRWQIASASVDFELVGYHHWQHRLWTKLNGFASGPSLAEVLAHPSSGQSAISLAILRGEEDSVSPDQQLMVGSNDRKYHSWGLQGLGHWRHDTERISSVLQWGFRLHGDQVERLHREDPYVMFEGALTPGGQEGEVTTENKASSLAFSAHLHEELGLGPVRLLPGVRLEVIRGRLEDRMTVEDSVATRAVLLPGFGFYAQPASWLGLLAGVHRGFSPVAPGQPEEVKPEESWNVEAGIRAAHRGGQVEVVGFFNDYRNMTGQCTLSAGCPQDLLDRQHNAGQVHVYGLEAQLSYRANLPRGFSVEPRLSYTWTGSRFQTSFNSPSPHFGSVSAGDSLAYVPEHRGAASFGLVHALGGVQVSVSAQTAMRDLPGQGELTEQDSVPAMMSVDVNAQLRISRHAQLYVTLTNITNEAHMLSRRPYGARPVRPFHAMAGLKLALGDQGVGLVETIREKQ